MAAPSSPSDPLPFAASGRCPPRALTEGVVVMRSMTKEGFNNSLEVPVCSATDATVADEEGSSSSPPSLGDGLVKGPTCCGGCRGSNSPCASSCLIFRTSSGVQSAYALCSRNGGNPEEEDEAGGARYKDDDDAAAFLRIPSPARCAC